MENNDWRDIANGLKIPTQSYSDQPYIIKTDDNAWLCCVTTGSGLEGQPGQYISTTRSMDCGKTWSAPVPVEKPGDAENSYAVMLKVPSGRIYIFYNHNTDNVREIKSHDGSKVFTRVDSLGHFVFKYSDDNGKSWSENRYDIPFRLFKCDLENAYQGKLCFFWNVGKPFVHGKSAFVPLIKVGQLGNGFFQQSEGVLLKSSNILFENDPDKIIWETLPDGDTGLKTPPGGGPISEEQSYVTLSDGTFYTVYRSIDGYPVESYSRDDGHTWSVPSYKSYADGRKMKHPRAANFTWKCTNGKYLYWFHNHGGHFIREAPGQNSPYDDRNPVWISGAVEADSPEGKILKWSQPEILFYDKDPFIRVSYPDMIEENGQYFISETQKDTARVHQIPNEFPEKIWKTLEGGKVFPDKNDIIFESDGKASFNSRKLPEFYKRDYSRLDMGGKQTKNGFTLHIDTSVNDRCIILDGKDIQDRGIKLEALPDGSLIMEMGDSWGTSKIISEPCLKKGERNLITIIVDGGPHVVSFVVNGKFLDGGEYRQFGWQHFSPELRHVNWAPDWKLSQGTTAIKIFGKAIMTAEAVSLQEALKN